MSSASPAAAAVGAVPAGHDPEEYRMTVGEQVPWVPVTSGIRPGKRKGEFTRLGLTSVVQPHIDPGW